MPVALGQPEADAELYLGRFGDVDPDRPVFQGDVYRDVRIPGFDPDDHDAVAVLQHPCTMRRGAALRPRVAVAPVRAYQYVPGDSWGHGFTRVFPLPGLSLVERQPHSAAMLDEPGSVAAEELATDRLVAQLSERGVLLFQQRLLYTGSHAVIELDTLAEFSAPVFAEAELLADWRAELVPFRSRTGTPEAAREAEALEFEKFIRHDTNIQERLNNVDTRADARRALHAEIERRVAVARAGSRRRAEGSEAQGSASESPTASS